VLGFREKTAPRLIKVAESNFSPARHLDDSEALAISRQIWGHAAGTQGHVSKDKNWYTPKTYIKMARKVMGSIDLDPASDAEAQNVVKAKRIYDEKGDSLQQTWHGRSG